MVEVFKTNVLQQNHADMLIVELHKLFDEYTANFDLEDCDKILRVKSANGIIQCCRLVMFLKDFGFHAEVLPDIAQPEKNEIKKKHYSSLPIDKIYYVPEVTHKK